MNRIISERRLVVILFVLVFITFSFAHEDSKQLEQIYSGLKPLPGAEVTASQTPDTYIQKEETKKPPEEDANLR
jgi:hypothetical protein